MTPRAVRQRAMNPRAVLRRVRHPQTTVRWRLALLYGALFLVSGAVLLTVTYVLVEHATVIHSPPGLFINGRTLPTGGRSGPGRVETPAVGTVKPRLPNDFSALPPRITQVLRSAEGQVAIHIVGAKQRVADLHQLIIESSTALAVMAIISGLLGWVVAGRVLRPLRVMTATAQQISEVNLHQRLALDGPPDELRQLADTIDRLLARLESAFEAQRRFVANASHELRTPLTAAGALLELVMSDPHATIETYRATCRQVLEESEQQEQLIESLLTLAQGERGIDRRAVLDLADITELALLGYRARAAERGVSLETSLAPALLAGDRRLVERLVVNLLENALRHNRDGGRVSVVVHPDRAGAELRVSNTGPVVPAAEITRLLQPFQRLGSNRTGYGEGFGLGLSIVAAIAGAHDAMLDVQPGDAGGLDIRVRFPGAPEGSRQPPLDEPGRSDVQSAAPGVAAGPAA